MLLSACLGAGAENTQTLQGQNLLYTGQDHEAVIPADAMPVLKKKIASLPVYTALNSTRTDFDWLLTPHKSRADVYATPDGQGVVVANAMVARTFRIFPNLATTDFVNRMTGESMLRAVSEEGSVSINGKAYPIGGLAGQPERAYIKPEWIDSMTPMPGLSIVEDLEVRPIEERIRWARSRWALNKQAPTGKEVVFHLRGREELSEVTMRLIVSVYDHIPVISKRFELTNGSASSSINVDEFKLEYLAFAEPESPGGGDPATLPPSQHTHRERLCLRRQLHREETDITEKWVEDPEYTTQRNYLLQTPCILDASPKMGPDQEVEPGATFSSFTVYEMPLRQLRPRAQGPFHPPHVPYPGPVDHGEPHLPPSDVHRPRNRPSRHRPVCRVWLRDDYPQLRLGAQRRGHLGGQHCQIQGLCGLRT